MVMKTQIKSIYRMFRLHLGHFLSLFFIVLVSVGFIAGFGTAADQIKASLTKYYATQNVSDFIVKSTSDEGFGADDVAAIRSLFPEAQIETGASLDVGVGEKRSVRLQFVDFEGSLNLPAVVEGTLPASEEEILAERADNYIEKVDLGNTVTLDFADILARIARQNGKELDAQTQAILERLPKREVTVCGIVQSPLHFTLDGDPSYNNPADMDMPDTVAAVAEMDLLTAIYYLPTSLIPTYRDIMPMLPDTPLIQTNDLYLTVEDRTLFDGFSGRYAEEIATRKARIEEAVPEVEVLTLQENYSFKSLASYSDKLRIIGYIIVAAFILVTALVAFSTMTRLLEEERAQIACLSTLGYSPAQILFKYFLFALTATAAGGAGAHFLSMGISALVYFVFGTNYTMPPAVAYTVPVFFFIVLGGIIAGTLAVTAITGGKMTNNKPAELLRPKAPRAGRKVFLERFHAVWKRIPFKYKSTLRNVFRYVNRFLMSVITIAFSMGLVLTGLALLDLCIFRLTGSAVAGVSVVIIIFAGLLTAVVIYTLTNISISERNREIATLMVLGYHDSEVTGYIYREIYINSILGALLGYPVGAALSRMLFLTIGSGTVGGISWFMWLIAPAVILLFTWLVTLILRRKIVKIDMNESLKAIE